MTLALAARRRYPLAVALVVTAADTVAAALTVPPHWVSVVVAWMCALYGLAVWTGTRAFLVGTAFAAASMPPPTSAPASRASCTTSSATA
jgi:hypothetical protein